MQRQIKSHLTGAIIFAANVESYAKLIQNALYEKVSLYGADLFGVDLSSLDLSDADLCRADLRKSILNNVKCINAQFQQADLRASRSLYTNFHRADFYRANVAKAIFDTCKFTEANLSYATATGANFKNSNLIEANLANGFFNQAKFDDGQVSGANCYRTHLNYSSFQRVNALNINFSFALLRQADFTDAELRRANFCHAQLNKNCFRGALLPAPTAILLADWGQVSDKLCKSLMRYDASNHGDPEAFNLWKENLTCPYKNHKSDRLAHFSERVQLWTPALLKRPPKTAYKLMIELLREKCIDSNYHISKKI